MAKLASFAFIIFALLLPFGRSSELAILLCIVVCAVASKQIRSAAQDHRTTFAGWACVLLALAASAFDSLDRADTLKTTANFLRYGFLLGAALLITEQHRQRIAHWLGVIALLWLADALCQAITGLGLRGASHSDRLSGIFGADHLKLGPILSLLTPFALFLPQTIAQATMRWTARALIWLACATVLLMAGSRASWVTFAVVSLLWAVHLARLNWRVLLGTGLILTLCGALTTSLLMKHDQRFHNRMTRTLALFDSDTADFALAGRMPIWRTSMDMIAAHPVNGVGARAFTKAYPHYAASNDPWLHADGTAGAAHAHQWILEALSETGVIGLLAWLMTLVFLLKHWRTLDINQRRLHAPWMIALIAMMNPFNTHLAMYSSYYGSVFWWLYAVCITIGTHNPRKTKLRDARDAQ